MMGLTSTCMHLHRLHHVSFNSRGGMMRWRKSLFSSCNSDRNGSSSSSTRGGSGRSGTLFIQQTATLTTNAAANSEAMSPPSLHIAPSVVNDKNIKLMQQINEIQNKTLAPLNDSILGPLERRGDNDTMTSLPFVFMLGNHSSGKSSFINYCLGRSIQDTGVAPTDDGFTIIAPGEHDIDQDGPSLIGNPDLGFSGLRSFGPSLIQRTRLKVRNDIFTNNFMLVDSPGMIDSPAHSQQTQPKSSLLSQSHISDRGYDFQAVVRWYAERADVIMLFVDPSKPGTTGETLSILTNSLVGMDHKLNIVLNKVDEFRKIHDFARAYGTLCWNLSKVIPRKDLPKIYTMCIPVKTDAAGNPTTETGLGLALSDLDSMRKEVVSEVMKAPERRVDNLITHLYDSSRLLKMYAEVYDDIRQSYIRERLLHRFYVTSALVAASSVAGLSHFYALPSEAVVGSVALGVLASSTLAWTGQRTLRKLKEELTSEEGLTRFFRKSYSRQIVEGDEFVLSLWKRCLPQLKMALSTFQLESLPKVKRADIERIQQIVDDVVPSLRREAAPTEKSFAHQVARILRRN